MEPAAYDATRKTGFAFELHHVQLSIPAGSEPDCRAFWIEGLGFVELKKPPVLAARGGVWLRADDVEIHLGVEKNFTPATKAHPGIQVQGIDALAKRIEGLGHAVTWDENFPGQKRLYTTDNCGNRIEFLEPSGAAPEW